MNVIEVEALLERGPRRLVCDLEKATVGGGDDIAHFLGKLNWSIF